MNDYFLDGKDSSTAGRKAGERLLEVAPELRTTATENRRSLGRAVRYLAEQGIRQFSDPGRQPPRPVARRLESPAGLP